MQITSGMRLRSAVGTTEIIVVRAPDAEISLTCGGVEMVALEDAVESSAVQPGHEGAALLGKRYTDEAAGIELLCTKGGQGQLACDGRALVIMAAKPLPSSD
jgi:hypothetical protein